MLRRRLGAIGAATALLAVAACGGGADNGDTAEGAPGGTLRVAVPDLPPGQGNPFTAVGSPSVYTWAAIFDSLTVITAEGETDPALATEWENVDETTWRFTLREDVTFSNGESFDAEAVAATVDYLLSEEGSTTVVGGELSTLASAEVEDEHSVVITTDEPDPILPTRISVMPIVAPQAWEELGPEGFATEPVGTGPFSVDSLTQNEVNLSAYEDSWRAPEVDSLSITRLAEVTPRTQALQSGQVDLAIRVAPDQITSLSDAGFTIETAPAQIMSLAFRQIDEDSPIADPRVRIALNHAVDREAMVESLLGGEGGVPTQGTSATTFGHNPDLPGFEYDPELARELLAEAGYEDGMELTSQIVVGSFAADSEIYQSAAANLAEVGVDLHLEQVSFAEWLERYQTDNWDLDMFGLSWNAAPILDASRPYTIFSCLKPSAFFCDEEVADLIGQADTEFDPAAREGLLQEVAARMQENPPSLLLVEQADINATGPQLQGYVDENRLIRYEDITVQ